MHFRIGSIIRLYISRLLSTSFYTNGVYITCFYTATSESASSCVSMFGGTSLLGQAYVPIFSIALASIAQVSILRVSIALVSIDTGFYNAAVDSPRF